MKGSSILVVFCAFLLLTTLVDGYSVSGRRRSYDRRRRSLYSRRRYTVIHYHHYHCDGNEEEPAGMVDNAEMDSGNFRCFPTKSFERKVLVISKNEFYFG